MPSDSQLVTLLRSLQTFSAQQDTPRLLSTASSLLAFLSNPRNLSLVTAQLLVSPAIWTHPEDLRSCLRFMNLFQSAAYTLLREEGEERERKHGNLPPRPFDQTTAGGGQSIDRWAKHVIQGADERSPRWRHALAICGLLVGSKGQEQDSTLTHLHRLLGNALVKAVNLALDDLDSSEELGHQCTALVMTYAFELLSNSERGRVNYDRLLPVLLSSAFFSSEGYQAGYFTAPIDMDIKEANGGKLSWSDRSSSFHHVSDLTSRPLIQAIGPLSRLIVYTIENVKDAWLIQTAIGDLGSFARSLGTQWRQNRISQIDRTEESIHFDGIALTKSLPLLWHVFKSLYFAVTITLRAVMGRLLVEDSLANEDAAIDISVRTLHVLRHLYFISNRFGGANTFSQYAFTNFASIDVLSNHPPAVEHFLHEIQPQHLGQVSKNQYDRMSDLFFLNTAEHFTFVLSPETNEHLLLAAATPYLTSQSTNQGSSDILEAAHSVYLAVLSAPQCTQLAVLHVPFYVDTLFRLFPTNISPRQFRLAFKTLLRITSPPSALSASHSFLAPTLLELLRDRTQRPTGSDRPGPHMANPTYTEDSVNQPSALNNHSVQMQREEGQSPEHTTLVLALIDCLPIISADLLLKWLPLVAELVQSTSQSSFALSESDRSLCAEHFWEVLSSGEMDVERSAICAGWWGTSGGRDAVVGRQAGGSGEEAMMSGALSIAKESKL